MWYEPRYDHSWGHWHCQSDEHCTPVKTDPRCGVPAEVEEGHHRAEDEIEPPSGKPMRRCALCKILGASRIVEGRFITSDIQVVSAALNLEGALAQLAAR